MKTNGKKTVDKKQIQIGLVYSAKAGGLWLPVRIDKSLGHGRCQGAAMPSGKTVRVSTDAIRGDGQTVEEWEARRTTALETAAKVASKVLGIPVGAVAPKKAAATKAKKVHTPKGPRHSLANATILVLAGAKDPMNATAIVEQTTAEGLYEPGKGKTPEATLYSAMLRDKKGRFEKLDRQVDGKTQRGLWQLTDAGKAEVEAIKAAFEA